MKQAIMTNPGIIEYKNSVPIPEINDNQILLNIIKIGICGSDIHVYHGNHPFTDYPIIQGHEYSAIVDKVGKNITKVKPGDRVTARPQLVCGKCPPCRRGNYNICDTLKVQGFQSNGCAQDYFVMEEDRIVLLPNSLSFNEGALVEPLSVAAYATEKPGNIEDQNVVVFGAGTIGNFVAQAAHCRGAKNILIRDISEYRLNIAKQCGIKNLSNPLNESMQEACKRVFGQEGFTIAFEVSGAQPAISDAVNFIEKGGYIGIIGVFPKEPQINMAYVCEHEIQIKGSMMYKHEHYLQSIAWLNQKKIITIPIITKTFDFYNYLNAYKFIETQQDKVMKVMIDVN